MCKFVSFAFCQCREPRNELLEVQLAIAEELLRKKLWDQESPLAQFKLSRAIVLEKEAKEKQTPLDNAEKGMKLAALSSSSQPSRPCQPPRKDVAETEAIVAHKVESQHGVETLEVDDSPPDVMEFIDQFNPDDNQAAVCDVASAEDKEAHEFWFSLDCEDNEKATKKESVGQPDQVQPLVTGAETKDAQMQQVPLPQVAAEEKETDEEKESKEAVAENPSAHAAAEGEAPPQGQGSASHPPAVEQVLGDQHQAHDKQANEPVQPQDTETAMEAQVSLTQVAAEEKETDEEKESKEAVPEYPSAHAAAESEAPRQGQGSASHPPAVEQVLGDQHQAHDKQANEPVQPQDTETAMEAQVSLTQVAAEEKETDEEKESKEAVAENLSAHAAAEGEAPHQEQGSAGHPPAVEQVLWDQHQAHDKQANEPVQPQDTETAMEAQVSLTQVAAEEKETDEEKESKEAVAENPSAHAAAEGEAPHQEQGSASHPPAVEQVLGDQHQAHDKQANEPVQPQDTETAMEAQVSLTQVAAEEKETDEEKESKEAVAENLSAHAAAEGEAPHQGQGSASHPTAVEQVLGDQHQAHDKQANEPVQTAAAQEAVDKVTDEKAENKFMAMLQQQQKGPKGIKTPGEKEMKSKTKSTKATPFKHASMSVSALLALGGLQARKTKSNADQVDHGKDENQEQRNAETKDKDKKDKQDRKDKKNKKEKKKHKKDKKDKKEKKEKDGKDKGEKKDKKRKEHSDSDVSMSEEDEQSAAQILQTLKQVHAEKQQDDPMSPMQEHEAGQQKKRKLADAAGRAELVALQDANMLMIPNDEGDEDIEGDDLHMRATWTPD